MSYMGKVRPTVALTSSDIVDGAITTDKIVDDAVTDAKVANAINTSIAANTAKVTNATHTGDVTGATALTIAADAVDIAMLSATGTADATTFLRGDNAWASAGGDNTPAFEATMSGNQTLSYDSVTIVQFDTEVFDTDSAYDNTTNYRFTVPSGEGGKYYVWAKNWIEGPAATTVIQFWHNIYKNATYADGMYNEYKPKNSYGYGFTLMSAGVMDLAAADYIDVRAYLESTTGAAGSIKAATMSSVFGAYKLIGV